MQSCLFFWELDDTNFSWLIGLKRGKLFIRFLTVADSNVAPMSDTNDYFPSPFRHYNVQKIISDYLHICSITLAVPPRAGDAGESAVCVIKLVAVSIQEECSERLLQLSRHKTTLSLLLTQISSKTSFQMCENNRRLITWFWLLIRHLLRQICTVLRSANAIRCPKHQ